MSAIVEKIRKLLALAQSSEPEEAAAAAAHAERLMVEHAVSEEAVRGAKAREDEGSIESEILQRYMGASWKRSQVPMWHATLAGAMSRHFMCRIYYTPGCSITMVGRRTAREVFQATYFYVRGELERLCESAWLKNKAQGGALEHGRRWKTSFYAGAVSTISARLRDEQKRLESGTPDPGGVTSSGLVLAPSLGAKSSGSPQTAIVLRSRVAEVDEWLKRNIKLTSSCGGQTRPSWSAYQEGQSAGHAVALGKRATKALS